MIHSKMNELKQKESSMEMQKSPDSKMTFSELTDRLGQLCQLMQCCPFGSDTYIELRDEHDRLEKDLREGNYK